MVFAIFLRRGFPSQRCGGFVFGRRRFLGHLYVTERTDIVTAATMRGRAQYSRLLRSCDLIEARSDNARKKKYGPDAPSPAGTGLL